jgi:hypothetical protein
MKKRITLFVALSFLSLITFHAWAVPANPNPVETVQPDGAPITYFIKGDEKVNWLQSTDGYTLLRNESQFIVYADAYVFCFDVAKWNVVFGNDVIWRSAFNALGLIGYG